MRVLVMGASGTGTTTLGRALAGDLGWRVFDTDDYYWLPSTPPFKQKQDSATRLTNLLMDLREVRMYARVDPEFLVWAAQYEDGKMSGRSRERHEQWLSKRSCPILRIDGDTSTEDRMRRVRATIAETQNGSM